MRTVISLLLAAFTVASSYATGPATPNTPGTLPGDIIVDNTGTATYTIPIDVPPGTGGMLPEISLQYSSSGGNGVMGMGWSIGGLSAITRSPSTWLDDDLSAGFKIDPVDFDASDRFLLDGQRLIITDHPSLPEGQAPVFADYGDAGTLYRTEVESFTTVRAVGQITDNSGTPVKRGPESFIAYTKSGLIMEYGSTNGSNGGFSPYGMPTGDADSGALGVPAVLTWSLSRIQDTAGNYMDYEYETVTTSTDSYQLLKKIKYTGHTSGSTPYNEVEFIYGSRTDDVDSPLAESDMARAYLGGARLYNNQYLKQIVVKLEGAEVWRYDLFYEASPATGRLRLTDIQKTAKGTGGTSDLVLKETSFAWEGNVAATFRSHEVLFDSDIDIDLLNYTIPSPMFVDYDGDGKPELTKVKPNTYTGNQTQYFFQVAESSNGLELDSSTEHLFFDASTTNPHIKDTTSASLWGDFDGDATPDIYLRYQRNVGSTFSEDYHRLYLGDGETGQMALNYAAYTGNNFDVPIEPGGTGLYSTSTQVGDFDGDGISEVLNLRAEHMIYYRYHNGRPYSAGMSLSDNADWFIRDSSKTAIESGGTLLDRTYDVFDIHGAVGNDIRQAIGTGGAQNRLIPADMNGDGMDDLVVVYKSGRNVGVMYSQYNESSDSVDFVWDTNYEHDTTQYGAGNDPGGIPLTGAGWEYYLPQDVNQDGLTDLVLVKFLYWGNYYRVLVVETLMNTGSGFKHNAASSVYDYIYAEYGLINIGANPEILFYDFDGDQLLDVFINFNRPDVINFVLSTYTYPNPHVYFARAYRNTGDGFSTPLTVPDQLRHGVSYWGRSAVTDLFGDGVADFIYTGGWGLTSETEDDHFSFYFNLFESPPDMLVGVTNGLGALTEVDYKPITDNTIYTKGTSAKYPIQDVQMAMYVPTEVRKDDGLGNMYVTQYQYAGARTHVLGRGFLGFQTFTSKDPQTKITKIDLLAQDYPRTGMVLESSSYYNLDVATDGTINSGEILSRTRNYTYFDTVQGGTVFPFVAHSVEKKWEFGEGGITADTLGDTGLGYLNPSSATSHYAEIIIENRFDGQGSYWYSDSSKVDANGNEILPDDGSESYVYPNTIIEGNVTRVKIHYGKSTDVGYAGTQETVNTFFYGSEGFFNITGEVPGVDGPYLIGRLKEASVTSETADGTIETRESKFQYSTTTGLLTHEHIQPNATGADAYLKLSTEHVRDVYGNVRQTIETPGAGSLRTVIEHSDMDNYHRAYKQAMNALGDQETTDYDFRFGAATSLTGPNGRTTLWEFDALGRKTREARSDGTATTWEYVSTDPAVTGSVSPITVNTIDDADPLNPVAYSHPSAYYVTEKLVDASNDATEIGPSVTVYYDKLGREIRTVSEAWLGDAGDETYDEIAKDTGYNSLGQVTCVSENYKLADGTSGLKYAKSYYDELGRVVKAVTPGNTVTSTSYDKLTVTMTRNDKEGGVADEDNRHETDFTINQTVTTTKNLRGQDIKVSNGGSGPEDNTVEFTYDAFGNLEESFAASDETGTKVTMAYDLRGNKLSMSDPDMGNWTYAYDSFGRLTDQTDAKGQVTHMEYDALDRMTVRTTAYGAPEAATSKWFYTNSSQTPGNYDEVGALSLEVAYDSAIADPANEVSRRAYYYDEKGRLFVTLDKVRVEDGRYKYFYTQSRFDQYSRPTHTASSWRPLELEPSEFQLHYGWSTYVQKTTYNARGFVTQVEDTGQSDGGTPRVLWSDPEYNAHGQLLSYKMGDRVVVANSFDGIDRTLSGITAQNGTGNFYQRMLFKFDPLGNVKERKDERRNLTETFSYDRINRLKANTVVSSASGHAGFTYTLDTTYDNLGNITSREVLLDAANNKESLTYTYGARPHAVTQVSGTTTGTLDYAYDGNGAMASRTGLDDVITWTAFNKVGSIEDGANRTSFTYDAGHNRLTQTVMEDDGQGASVNKRRTIYAAGVEQVETYDAPSGRWATARTRVYVGTPAGTIGVFTETAGKVRELNWFLKDHLGSVVEVLRGVFAPGALVADAILESYAYGAWGEYRDAATWGYKDQGSVNRGSGDAVTERGFTGHEMLDEVGLVHMNGRIYDALIGKFLSADPFVQSPGNLQSYNRYSYVANNPLSFTDPSGFFLSGLFKSIGNFFKKFWKPIVAIVVAVVVAFVIPWALGGFVKGALFMSSSFGWAVAAGAASGAISGGGRGALFGALGAAAFFGVGQLFAMEAVQQALGEFVHLAKSAAHGVTGGALQAAQGGDYLAGFAAGGFTQFVSPGIDFIGGKDGGGLAGLFGRVAAASVVGGTASTLAGGKFENGAVTGAFSQLFNEEFHTEKLADGAKIALDDSGVHVHADNVKKGLTYRVELDEETGNFTLKSKGKHLFDEKLAKQHFNSLMADKASNAALRRTIAVAHDRLHDTAKFSIMGRLARRLRGSGTVVRAIVPLDIANSVFEYRHFGRLHQWGKMNSHQPFIYDNKYDEYYFNPYHGKGYYDIHSDSFLY